MIRRFIVVASACAALAGTAVAGFSIAAPVADRPLGPAVGAGRAQATAVTVRMTEYAFALSQNQVPAGTVTFTVINEGSEGHDFEIAGRKTPVIPGGTRTTLTVNFTQAGQVPYICTVGEHAIYGMNGFLTVVGQGGQTTTPTPPPTASYRVNLSEFKIVIRNSRGQRVTSIRRGTVRFNVKNVGRIGHNFVIRQRQTPVLRRNGTATLVVTLPRGRFRYICSIAGHPAAGMRGILRVT